MSANSPFGCPECGRLSSAEQITALRAEVERLARSAQSWEAEALRYAQNAGHHEKRGAESRRLLEEEVLPLILEDTPDEPATEHDLRKVSLIGAIRAHLAGGEPAGSSISPYDPEAVAKALAGGER